VTSLGFVAGTPQVLASSGDKTVRLVNVDNGQTLRSYSGPTDFVYSTATSADGRLAVGGGQDSVLYVWLVADGQLLKSLPAPKAEESKPAAGQTAGG
jgi:WD40 repeat protein